MTRLDGREAGLFSLGFAFGALAVAILVSTTGATAQRGVSAHAREEPRRTTIPAQAGKEPPLPSAVEPLPRIGLPIAGLKLSDIHDTFHQGRGEGRSHQATDIMQPRGTPVVTVDSGVVVKLFNSRNGGLTVYQFDSSRIYCYYYAHLDRYAEGLAEGMAVRRGDTIGYVGSTGNANPNGPHLHFGITRIGPDGRWWGGTPIDPYPLLVQALKK